MQFNAGQEEAISSIMRFIEGDKDFYTLSGKAGTGKTTIISKIINIYGKRKKIAVAALSHKAKSVIEGKCKYGKFYTIAGLLGFEMNSETGKFVKLKDSFAPIQNMNLIFIDECSMINEQILDLIYDLKPEKAKVVFIGDIGQLPPIRTLENPYYIGKEDLMNTKSPTFLIDGYTLTERVRQGEESPILPYADNFWTTDITFPTQGERLNVENDKGSLTFEDSLSSISDFLIEQFKYAVDTKNPNWIKVVCYRNSVRESINSFIHESLFDSEYGVGEIIMFNDQYGETYQNGSEWIVKEIIKESKDKFGVKTIVIKLENDDWIRVVQKLDIPKYKLIVSELFNKAFEEKKIGNYTKYRSLLSDAWDYKRKYAPIDYAYAITSHKSQGSTYHTVVVNESDINSVGVLSDKAKAESIYTAITRASNKVIIV